MLANRRSIIVRIGLFGQVGRFRVADGVHFERGSRVVCRTRRGLEVGEVRAVSVTPTTGESFDGLALRQLTVEDELLLSQLEKNQRRAFNACVELLAARGSPAVLVDVEHLFDGRSLYFHFLGEVPAELGALSGELAEAYDAEVQFRAFASTLHEGCGPDCGTEAASDCGKQCTGCAIADRCEPR